MLYIDNFPTQPKDCNSPKIFLLSHSHADHLNGLDQLYNSQCYASQVTIDILTLKYPLKYKNVNFIPLEFETETEIIGIDQGVSVTVAVTMIDVNHCAGYFNLT